MGCIPSCISERRKVVGMTLFSSFVLSFLVWLASPSTTEEGAVKPDKEDAMCQDGLTNGRLARETLWYSAVCVCCELLLTRHSGITGTTCIRDTGVQEASA